VSVDLAREAARRLGRDLQLVVFDAAGKSVQAVRDEQADIGFFAIDPLRGEGIAAEFIDIVDAYVARTYTRKFAAS
jgi:polar amino acid transport system substrate-binding protein